MSFESDLKSLLAGVCVNVYPDKAPNDPPLPYVIYHQIGGPVITPINGSVPDKQGAFIQIEVWSTTRSQSNALMDSIEAAMFGASVFIARPLTSLISRIEPGSDLRGAIQDFRVWAAR